MPVLSQTIRSPILEDESLTRGLGDAEARLLIEWLVDHAETVLAHAADAAAGQRRVADLCRRARVLGRFVSLWSRPGMQGAAHQLAASERLTCPLPAAGREPWEVLRDLLAWEERVLAQGPARAA